ncbi:unnamed protein product [Oppiella nova]|uniref:Uncharacterized protein n=1 Tax=Oppiella nova TaxID=334625 RepID=A0A7R9QG46_9ACAR|nr:unnamed protein product [Oppiella nova]CAG2165165.1 unnamed protein product [Oppiella nova]
MGHAPTENNQDNLVASVNMVFLAIPVQRNYVALRENCNVFPLIPTLDSSKTFDETYCEIVDSESEKVVNNSTP